MLVNNLLECGKCLSYIRWIIAYKYYKFNHIQNIIIKYIKCMLLFGRHIMDNFIIWGMKNTYL